MFEPVGDVDYNPVIILLSKIFYKFIQEEIKIRLVLCIEDLIEKVFEINIDNLNNNNLINTIKNIRKIFSPITDAHMYNYYYQIHQILQYSIQIKILIH